MMDDKLTIGQMARLNNISGRTLRIYHDMGLLIPEHIDKSNCYRYYSKSQSTQLEMILQMKSAGISLKQIKNILDNKDITLYEKLLYQKINAIGEEISKLKENQKILQSKINNCKQFLNPPTLGNIFLDYLPERKTYFFDIHPFSNSEKDKCHWDASLQNVKNALFKCGMPITYFSDVGCFISKDDLLKDQIVWSGAVIMADGKPDYKEIRSYIIPANTYVCVYEKWYSGDNQAEPNSIKKLMQYIRTHNFEICGDYIAEVEAESILFDFNRRLYLIKLQIPVNLSENQRFE